MEARAGVEPTYTDLQPAPHYTHTPQTRMIPRGLAAHTVHGTLDLRPVWQKMHHLDTHS